MYRRTSLLLAVLLFTLSTGNAQTVTQSGYAIITLQGGTDSALTAVETLFNMTAFGTTRTAVAPSQILTSAVLPVRLGPTTVSSGTNLVLVNPSPDPATVNLVVTNASGVEILNRTILISVGEQLFQSVNALFVNPPDSIVESTALLTITSNVGIAVQAVEFPDVGVTTVPITVLAGSFPVSVAINPPPQIPFIPLQTSSRLPPTTIGIAPPVTTRLGIFTLSVTPPMTTAQLQPPVTIGGASSLIFPLVRTGDGSATSFTVGNTTTFPLAFRIDLFNSSGDLIASIADISVPPRGLVVFSSESSGVLIQ